MYNVYTLLKIINAFLSKIRLQLTAIKCYNHFAVLKSFIVLICYIKGNDNF